MLSLSSCFLNAIRRPPAALLGFNLTNEDLHRMTTFSNGQLQEMIKKIIPPLFYEMHKGEAGRVAVIGGCKEYTGAPYFAAISALKVGADLSHVFCTSDAASVIKSYSPELIVHPVLDSVNAIEEISQWLPRFHSLVIGPGLGRDEAITKNTTEVIAAAKAKNIPLVIDADGLFVITQNPALIKDYTNVVLTPNVVEFARLYEKLFNKKPDDKEPVVCVKQVCRELGNITICRKGKHDVISNGSHVLLCSEPGSPRRCGGQGDLLSGSMGIFTYWAWVRYDACLASSNLQDHALLTTYGPGMCAAFAACLLTRECSQRAFKINGRSMTTSDMIAQIHNSFDYLYS